MSIITVYINFLNIFIDVNMHNQNFVHNTEIVFAQLRLCKCAVNRNGQIERRSMLTYILEINHVQK